MTHKNWLKLLVAGGSLLVLSGCGIGIAKDYSASEKEMVSTMTPSKYQPATRQMRTSIETQDLLAQAAFWSREYQLNPADLEAAVKLASSVRKMGNASKAAEITQTTRAMYPDDPYLIAEHSAALIALEKGREAIKPLDKALHSAPGYARLWSLKGAALDQLGQYDGARQHYSRALQITPNDPNIMANMGLSFALAGDPRTAEQWLRRAAGHPDAGDGIRQNLDLVLQLQGKPSSALPAAPKSAARAPAPSAAAPQNRPPQNRQAYGQQPQARGSYTPPIQFGQPMQNPAHLGHRSSVAVVGNQPGAPRNAMEMARAAAAQSSQNRVVVPHQPTPQQPQGNILDRIGQSVSRKQATAPMQAPPNYPQAPMQGQAPVQGMPYPAPQQTAPSGYPGYAPQGANTERRRPRRR